MDRRSTDARSRCAVLLGALLALLTYAPAYAAVALPKWEEDPPAFARAPQPWRNYLLKAKTARLITDPLQRCLAYPDLPGNAWPKGHAAAHCRDRFKPYLQYAEVAELVKRNDVRTLENELSVLLRQHFSSAEQSEAIHHVFNSFVIDTAGADAISQQWLQQAPKSAYANMARGRYLRSLGWKSRGTRRIADTSEEGLRQMSRYFAEAVPLLRKAIAAEPKLMPAYISLLDIGMADSQPELRNYAVEAGFRQDPACVELLTKELQSLQPRWGGSYAQMEAAVGRVKRYVARRPLLAIDLAAPYADMGNRSLADELYGQAALSYEQGAKLGSHEEALREAGRIAWIRDDDQRDRWKALVYLVQADRFEAGGARHEREMGRLLVDAGDPEWAIPHLKRALELAPGNAYAHFYLAVAYDKTAQPNIADELYYRAMINEEFSRDAALEGAEMWLKARMPKRAKPYLDRLSYNYSKDPYGRFLRLLWLAQVSGHYDQAGLRRFIEETDPSADRRLPGAIAFVNGLLADMSTAGTESVPAVQADKK